MKKTLEVALFIFIKFSYSSTDIRLLIMLKFFINLCYAIYPVVVGSFQTLCDVKVRRPFFASRKFGRKPYSRGMSHS